MSYLTFSPLLPWIGVAAVAVVCLAALGIAYARGHRRIGFRMLALSCAILALSGPQIRSEQNRPLSDIIVALVDRSTSQQLGQRAAQTEAALVALRMQARGAGAELREISIGDDSRGTLAMGPLRAGLSDVDPDRLSGVVILSDGQIHDADLAPQIGAPMHLLLAGTPEEWDRKLTVPTAPAFGIVGEQLPLSLRVDDLGAAPGASSVRVVISLDGGPGFQAVIPIGRTFDLPIVLPHGDANLIEISTPMAEGELTGANNTVVLQINGVRDRLRVLLASGEPYLGTRTWRNLLKSDPGVDLVHFTILRPPEAIDGTPASELALIAFPTQELFVDKIDEFDLIIFDRYSLRGILTPEYLGNIRAYAENGGAILFTAGPEFAGNSSLARSALGPIIPALPNQTLIEQPFRPSLTDLGRRHPVTQGIDRQYLQNPWGRWMRQVGLNLQSGDVVMEGAESMPLLILDRVGEGRVALLASDQTWLWARGFEGGGPQAQLLRNLSYWLMKEPDLEEEALSGAVANGVLTVSRKSLALELPDLHITFPDGREETITMKKLRDGYFEAQVKAERRGLYRLSQGGKSAVVASGMEFLREYADPIASGEPMAQAIEATGGGILRLAAGEVALRTVRPGGHSSGRGWIGVTPRGARETVNVTLVPLLPGWGWLCLVIGATCLAWLAEGGFLSRPRRTSMGPGA